ncbi:hypothetical protein [Methyloprofundus sp.]|uniref:hypothetical protein n=1 Tax=Methyloprofundus sp. TaxID=2020875 RepID=UPI003D0D2F94
MQDLGDILTPIKKVANRFFSNGGDNTNHQGYFFSIGQRCVVKTGETIANGSAASCYFENVDIPTAFWNDAHPATQFQQVIATAVLDQLSEENSNRRNRREQVGPTYEYTLEEIRVMLAKIVCETGNKKLHC